MFLLRSTFHPHNVIYILKNVFSEICRLQAIVGTPLLVKHFYNRENIFVHHENKNFPQIFIDFASSFFFTFFDSKIFFLHNYALAYAREILLL